MCYFCYAQLFEITHLTNIKSTLVQHSCRNAEVVEAFCRVAASRSNTRRSIHPPSENLHTSGLTLTWLPRERMLKQETQHFTRGVRSSRISVRASRAASRGS